MAVADVEKIAVRLQHLLEDQRRGLRLHPRCRRLSVGDPAGSSRCPAVGSNGEEGTVADGLEVLAIIAFKQPVTRADIEKLRGVSSERVLTSLVQQGLVVDLGRKDSPGRPILYGTSAYFLECIGMDSLADLAGRLSVDTTEDGFDGRTVAESNE